MVTLRWQKERLKTILRSLAKLQNEITNEDVLDCLTSASFDVAEALKELNGHNKRARHSLATLIRVTELYQAGAPHKVIQAECGVSRELIRRLAHKHGWRPRRVSRSVKMNGHGIEWMQR